MSYQQIDELLKKGKVEEAFRMLVALYQQGDKSKQVVINLMNLVFNTQPPESLEGLINETYNKFKDDDDYKYIVGAHYLKTNRIAEAEKLYLDIKNKFKDNPTFLVNLGSINLSLGKKEFAKSWYEKAIKVDPNFSAALIMLATLYDSETNYEKTIECLKKALEINPNDPATLNNLGNVYKNVGLLHDSVELYEKALKLNPEMMMVWTNLLLASYNITEDYEQINKRFNSNFPCKNIDRHFYNMADTARKLRVGFISPDFKQHSVGFFTLPLFKHYDRSKFEFYIYSDNPKEDSTTEEFKKNSDNYTIAAGLTDDQVKNLIDKHHIDIMVDLALVSGYNRLSLFKDLVAPVQVSWLGSNGSVSLESMTGRLISNHLISEEEIKLSKEPLIDIGESMFSFENTETPDRKHSPVDENGFITFSCFAYPAKLSQQCVEFYAKVLKAVPNSKIIFKYKSYESALTKKVLLDKFKVYGDFEDRFEFFGFSNTHLDNYLKCDFTLDSFPYNGTTTLCDSVSTATPFFALKGKTSNSLQGYMIAKNLGEEYFQEFAGETQEELLEKIVKITNDREKIHYWHKNLKDIFLKSCLSDHKGFATRFCNILRNLWQEYCTNIN